MKASAFVPVLALLAGCGGARESLREKLELTIDHFHAHLVAGDADRAASYVALDAREAFLDGHDPNRGAYRLEEFQLVSMRDDPATGSTSVTVDASVRHPASITIRRVRYREVWQPAKGGWHMVSEEVVPVERAPANRSAPAPSPQVPPSIEATIPLEQP